MPKSTQITVLYTYKKRYLNLARSTNLAFLSRTPISIIDHGENREAHWSPDGSRIVIKTSDSYLVLVTVIFHPDETIYQAPPLSANAQRNFLAGPGEAFPLSSVSLQFEGVIRVEGTLVRIHQRYSEYLGQQPQKKPWGNEDLTKRSMERGGVESWIASDGRAYIVYLIRNDEPSSEELPSDSKNASNINLSKNDQLQTQKLDNPRFADGQRNMWMGTCIHHFETPRWVQKQRRVEPEEHGSVYFEPRRAVRLAINAKFSLIASFFIRGGIQYTTFPADEGAVPTSQQIEIHNPFNRRTGRVCSMEWSSDGYVLAVGWQHGWGLFNVGGRCLVSGFGVEDVDEQKLVLGTRKFRVDCARSTFFEMYVTWNLDAVNQSLTLGIAIDEQLFVIPFAKSATTGQHSPDNTRYAFLQLEDRALVYRGADQPDISIIDPESDVWQHIKANFP
ncbi:hypothetical protein GG344DRAFT_82968 [Lentinula edodes]|nr:hypothetical protein GG344DRAFT_82968 [Lentinula edodes]